MTAVLSTCATYRYRLERVVSDSGRTVAGIMVNPSTADAINNDQTIRKWVGFSQRLGVSKFIIGNKFAFRATDIKDLRTVADPVGPDNDRHLEQILRDADLHIVAWGSLAKLPKGLRERWRDILFIAKRVGCPLYCFGKARDGHPLHPLTLGYDRDLMPWSPAA